jgi:hypothetical protein
MLYTFKRNVTAAEIAAFYAAGGIIAYCPPRAVAPSRQLRERDIRHARKLAEQRRVRALCMRDGPA